MLHLKGMSPMAAGAAAGYTPAQSANLLQRQEIKRALKALRENTFYDFQVTRDKLTQMLFDAHSHSANTTEEVLAIREMAKLHGRYAPVEKTINVDVQGEIKHQKQIERLTDDQLGKLIGEEIILDPDAYEVSDG